MEKEQARRLYVQAAEALMILQDKSKLKKKAFLEIDALIGRLLRAAIETLDDATPEMKVAAEISGLVSVDTPE